MDKVTRREAIGKMAAGGAGLALASFPGAEAEGQATNTT
jgi:hypothetical protein